MRIGFSASTLLLGLVFASASARAEGGNSGEAVDDLDLVKLLNVEVSTATKTAESLDDAPAVITVVTHDDIERWGYRTVAEVLDHTVGFYLIDDDILPNASVRGIAVQGDSYSDEWPLRLDGHGPHSIFPRIADRPGSRNLKDSGPVPVAFRAQDYVAAAVERDCILAGLHFKQHFRVVEA